MTPEAYFIVYIFATAIGLIISFYFIRYATRANEIYEELVDINTNLLILIDQGIPEDKKSKENQELISNTVNELYKDAAKEKSKTWWDKLKEPLPPRED